VKPDSILRTSRVPLRPPVRRPLWTRVLIRFRRLWWLLLLLLYRWRRLAFTMQPQQQTQWCWAAVAVSVSHYYDPSSTWTQCGLANGELNQTTCCQDGSSAACNVPWFLDRALQRTGNLNAFSSGVTSFAGVRTEINGGRPLGVRIGWSGGGGHFAVIAGYKPGPGEQRLAIEDPWYGASDLTYADFQSSYEGTGSWTHSYTTRS
jgi:hypothetical protein